MTETKQDCTTSTTIFDKPVSDKTDDNSVCMDIHNVKFSKPEYSIYRARRVDNPSLPSYIYSMDGSAPISVGGSIHKRVVVQGSDNILKITSINGVQVKFAYNDYYYHAMLTDVEIKEMVGDDVYDG